MLNEIIDKFKQEFKTKFLDYLQSNFEEFIEDLNKNGTSSKFFKEASAIKQIIEINKRDF